MDLKCLYLSQLAKDSCTIHYITINQTQENKVLLNQHLSVQMKKAQKMWGVIPQIFEMFQVWRIKWVINTRLSTPTSLSSPLIFLLLSQVFLTKVNTRKHLLVQ